MVDDNSGRPEAGPPASAQGDSGQGQTFLRRLLSTVVLWSLVIGAFVAANSWVFLFLVAVIVVASLLEYFAMLEVEGVRPWRNAVVGAAALYVAGLFWLGHFHGVGAMAEFDALAIAVVTGLVLLMQVTRKLDGRDTMARLTSSLFGFLYLPFLFGFVVKIFYLPGLGEGGAVLGHFYVLYLIVVTKFTDMGAYLVGSLIGRHKMIPHISPKKTWEGLGGAFLFAFAASFGLKLLFGAEMPLISWAGAGFLAFLLGCTAVVGDLAESILKRSSHTKDSGHVLPGIGGTLDLIDSVCFSAPLLYFYLRAVS